MPNAMPLWFAALSDEDIHFLKRFLLASGSLKALAKEYGVSYPTIRARLDRLIEKVKAADAPQATDAFRRQVQLLVAEGVIGVSTARGLLDAHEQVLAQKRGGSYDAQV